jgi:hypothetical protein
MKLSGGSGVFYFSVTPFASALHCSGHLGLPSPNALPMFVGVFFAAVNEVLGREQATLPLITAMTITSIDGRTPAGLDALR